MCVFSGIGKHAHMVQIFLDNTFSTMNDLASPLLAFTHTHSRVYTRPRANKAVVLSGSGFGRHRQPEIYLQKGTSLSISCSSPSRLRIKSYAFTFTAALFSEAPVISHALANDAVQRML